MAFPLALVVVGGGLALLLAKKKKPDAAANGGAGFGGGGPWPGMPGGKPPPGGVDDWPAGVPLPGAGPPPAPCELDAGMPPIVSAAVMQLLNSPAATPEALHVLAQQMVAAGYPKAAACLEARALAIGAAPPGGAPPGGGGDVVPGAPLGLSVSEVTIRAGDTASGYAAWYAAHMAPQGGTPFLTAKQAVFTQMGADNKHLHGQSQWSGFTVGRPLYLRNEWVQQWGTPAAPTSLYQNRSAQDIIALGNTVPAGMGPSPAAAGQPSPGPEPDSYVDALSKGVVAGAMGVLMEQAMAAGGGGGDA